MQRCTRCIMVETKPGISFTKAGVCNACQNAELKKKIDYAERMEELREVVTRTKDRKPEGYDCVIPVSGGKDSTFLAVFARDELGLTPLLVCVEPVYVTERGKQNLHNLSRLGFDTFVFKPNQQIMPTLLKRSFIEDGQPVRAFEFMLYSVPMRVAMNYVIPLVIWGENPQFEYGNEGDVDKGASAAGQKDITALAGQDATVWIDEGIVQKHLVAFQHPTEEELSKSGVEAVYLSHYVHWDSRETASFAVNHGLITRPEHELLGTGGYWEFEQLDDEIPVISHLLKYIKYGYGRATDQACRDIREGHITREQGLELAAEYDGHCNADYIRRYCDYIGITQEEFWRIADSFRNRRIWEERDTQWVLCE